MAAPRSPYRHDPPLAVLPTLAGSVDIARRTPLGRVNATSSAGGGIRRSSCGVLSSLGVGVHAKVRTPKVMRLSRPILSPSPGLPLFYPPSARVPSR